MTNTSPGGTGAGAGGGGQGGSGSGGPVGGYPPGRGHARGQPSGHGLSAGWHFSHCMTVSFLAYHSYDFLLFYTLPRGEVPLQRSCN
jgi:hypothetical protein